MEVEGMAPSLYKAAASGNVDFLSNNRDEDILLQKTPKKNNVLHIAAQFKQTKFFQEFSTHDIRSSPLFWDTNNKCDTPMHVAARVGCDELVEFLIDLAKNSRNVEAAADVETRTASAEAYKGLLRKTNSENDTALHVAVKFGCHTVVNLLVDADHELCRFKNNANESPLFLAISKGFPKIASSILDKSPASSLSFDGIGGVTALHAAVTRESTCKDIVKIMVTKYPELIRKVDELGWTPLHYAAFKGNVEATTSLIEQDSSVAYILDKSGMSALHVAAHGGHIEVMKQFIRLRPDSCDLLNHKGQTVVHAAVLGENLLAIRYILMTPELAGLVNEADNDGNTPLHVAASLKSTFIMEALARDPKVDKTATNNHHSKALDIFLGDDIELVSDTVSLGRCNILRLLGRSVGVPIFQRCVLCDFTKLESTVDETVASTTTPIANNKSVKALVDKSKKFDTILLVAILIATVTFAAAFTIPGGFNNRGTAVLHRRATFIAFVFFDAISFFLSIYVVFDHFMVSIVSQIIRLPPSWFISCSIAAMVAAFGCGIAAVLDSGVVNTLFFIAIWWASTSIIMMSSIRYAHLPTQQRNRPRIWLQSRII